MNEFDLDHKIRYYLYNFSTWKPRKTSFEITELLAYQINFGSPVLLLYERYTKSVS